MESKHRNALHVLPPGIPFPKKDILNVSQWVWVTAATLAVCCLIAASIATTGSVMLAGGITVVGVFILIVLVKPFEVLWLVLLLGPFSLMFLTADRALLVSWGGFNPDGLKNTMIIIAFGMLLLLRGYIFEKTNNWPYVVFLAVAGASLLYTEDFNEGARLYYKLIYPYMIYFSIMAIAKTEAQLKALEKAIIWSAIIAAVLAIVILLAGKGLVTRADQFGLEAVEGAMRRFRGGIRGPLMLFDFYAGLIVVYFVALYFFKKKSIYLVVVATYTVFVTLSLTRMVMFAVIICSFMLAVLSRQKLRGCLFVLLLLCVPLVSSGGLIERFMSIDASTGSYDFSGRDKTFVYLYERFIQQPFFGIGLGSANKLAFAAVGAHHPHMEYMRILTELGVVGIVLFLSGYWKLFKGSLRTFASRYSINKQRGAVAATVLVYYGLICLTDNGLSYFHVSIYVWSFVAIAIASVKLNHKTANRER